MFLLRATWLIVCLALVASSAAMAAPSNCRIYLAGQYLWGEKLGFYVDMEGAELATLPVILGIADGNGWRFVSHAPGFDTGRDYQVRAEIGPEGGKLFLDGELVTESPGRWQPHSTGRLETNYRPSWADEPGDWVALVSKVDVRVMRDGEQVDQQGFAGEPDERSVAVQLFEPGLPRLYDKLDTQPGDTVIAEVVLRFSSSDLKTWAPLIDQYGQCKYADWPEKVRSDDDLRNDIAAEDAELAKMPPSEDMDPYGGYTRAGWTEEATGFFYAIKRDGYWWLITPDGNPCFYLGVCNVPATTWPTTPVTDREFLFETLPERDGQFAPAWSMNQWGVNDGSYYFAFYSANLIRKYGAERWQDKATERALRRLKSWGFGGGGKWGSPSEIVSTPVLQNWGTPKLVEHADVFDPAVCDEFRKDLEKQITPRRDDPFVLGWSLGNEYPECIKTEEIIQILGKPAGTPAKRAFVDYALRSIYGDSRERLATAWKIENSQGEALYAATPEPPAEDVEQLRILYADKYYEFIYKTVKSIDPNHLYLGYWIVPGWWVNEEDWRLIARHCDVIGYDRYRREYPEERLERLQTETDKAVLCGEFSFPAWYDGQRAYGRYGVSTSDDAESGELYFNWTRDAARDPHCVGLIWFHYRDQSLTGRGPGRGEVLTFGEHFAFGLVTEADRPKWPLLRRMREANLEAPKWRLQAREE